MKSKFAIFAIVAVGFITQGCSTPPNGANTSDYESMRQEAWSAYNSCLDALTPQGRQAECDSVTSTSQTTTNIYNYGYQGTPSGSYYQPTQVQSPQDYYGYSTPPPYYIYSATPEDVNAATGKWLSLAQDPEKAL